MDPVTGEMHPVQICHEFDTATGELRPILPSVEVECLIDPVTGEMQPVFDFGDEAEIALNSVSNIIQPNYGTGMYSPSTFGVVNYSTYCWYTNFCFVFCRGSNCGNNFEFGLRACL